MTEIRFRNPRDIHGAHRQMSHQATRNTVGQCFKAAWESRSQGLKVKSPFPPDTSRIELFIFMYVLYLCFMIFHVNLQKLMLLQQGVCLFLPLSYLCCFMPCPTVTKSSSHMLISMVKRTATWTCGPTNMLQCLFVSCFSKIRNLTFNNLKSFVLANESWRYWSLICFERYECTKTWCFTHMDVFTNPSRSSPDFEGRASKFGDGMLTPKFPGSPLWKGLLLRGTPIRIPRIPNHRAPNRQFAISWWVFTDFYRFFCEAVGRCQIISAEHLEGLEDKISLFAMFFFPVYVYV